MFSAFSFSDSWVSYLYSRAHCSCWVWQRSLLVAVSCYRRWEITTVTFPALGLIWKELRDPDRETILTVLWQALRGLFAQLGLLECRRQVPTAQAAPVLAVTLGTGFSFLPRALMSGTSLRGCGSKSSWHWRFWVKFQLCTCRVKPGSSVYSSRQPKSKSCLEIKSFFSSICTITDKLH